MKFNKLFNLFMEQIRSDEEIDDTAFYFLNDKKNKKILNNFKKILNFELNKIKSVEPKLSNIKLSFDDAYAIDNEYGTIFASFRPETNKIEINMIPFVHSITNNIDFNDAISDYFYFNNKHIIQHECAHALDWYENGDRRNSEMHDDKFIFYENKLNEKTHLNKF